MPAGGVCLSATVEEQREKLVNSVDVEITFSDHKEQVLCTDYCHVFTVSSLLEYHKPVYENSDLAKCFLTSDAAFSLHGYIQHCNSTVWPLFTHLENAVREGTNQHEKAFGKKSEDMFQVTSLPVQPQMSLVSVL